MLVDGHGSCEAAGSETIVLSSGHQVAAASKTALGEELTCALRFREKF